jgi:hypothetical protein
LAVVLWLIEQDSTQKTRIANRALLVFRVESILLSRLSTEESMPSDSLFVLTQKRYQSTKPNDDLYILGKLFFPRRCLLYHRRVGFFIVMFRLILFITVHFVSVQSFSKKILIVRDELWNVRIDLQSAGSTNCVVFV